MRTGVQVGTIIEKVNRRTEALGLGAHVGAVTLSVAGSITQTFSREGSKESSLADEEARKPSYGTASTSDSTDDDRHVPKPKSFWQFYRVNVGKYVLLLLGFLCTSAAIFCGLEGLKGHRLDYFDAFWFCFITITTIGYSDGEITTGASVRAKYGYGWARLWRAWAPAIFLPSSYHLPAVMACTPTVPQCHGHASGSHVVGT